VTLNQHYHIKNKNKTKIHGNKLRGGHDTLCIIYNLKNKHYIPIVSFGYVFAKCMDAVLLYLPVFEVESPRVVSCAFLFR
jgi:hypothetical protein